MQSVVSIIMAAYNAQDFIEEAINSVLQQTYPNWELIVVNDGSRDDTDNIVASYNDDRIKYLSQKNAGVSSARNLGLSKMQGEYFCFLDADDCLPSDSLSSRINVFKENSDVQYVDGQVEFRDSALKEILKFRSADFFGTPIPALCNLDERCFFGNTWMFKRKKGMNYAFDTFLTHGEDLLFYLEHATAGKLASTKNVTLHYRTGIHSAMSDLKGLESGYRYIHKQILLLSHVNDEDHKNYWLKSRSIMFKSYLGKFSLINALRVWLTW